MLITKVMMIYIMDSDMGGWMSSRQTASFSLYSSKESRTYTLLMFVGTFRSLD